MVKYVDVYFFLFSSMISLTMLVKFACRVSSQVNSPWKWVCLFEKCVKARIDDYNEMEPILGIETCKMFCEKYVFCENCDLYLPNFIPGLLWPRPTGHVDLGTVLLPINIHDINIMIEKPGKTDHLMEAASERFRRIVFLVIPDGWISPRDGRKLDIYLVNQKPNDRGFKLRMNESYTLNISLSKTGVINATITGANFFGVRHGLETLSQLIIYDEIRDHVLISRDVAIDDKPVFPYRGIMLDTATNYYTIDSIKKTIDAMAAVKLNTFHWHISDVYSFPFVSHRRPELSNLGAYSPVKVYTKQAIREVVQYGYERGVRILPEFNGPAHVGEGWQDTNVTICFRAEPWYLYCKEPPCGQFNPIKDELYDYLLDIYLDMAEAFQSDIFHMGGNEVSEACWSSSFEIREYIAEHILKTPNLYAVLIANHKRRATAMFKKIWSMYQNRTQEKLYEAFGKNLPIILWSSDLTDPSNIEKFLNKTQYIIQIWSKTGEPVLEDLTDKGYNVILSNQDIYFLNCGLESWIGTGSNWCSPYNGWKEIYSYSPSIFGKARLRYILGGEVCLSSEQTDSSSLDMRLWPRAAALAERFWSDPAFSWVEAEARILRMRERLARMGINSDVLQPEWCYHNHGACYGRAFIISSFISSSSLVANILISIFGTLIVTYFI